MNFHTKYRILEIIPGSLVWLTLILALVLSLAKPIWAIYFIIIFDLYWLIRIIYFILYLFISWFKYRQINKTNWRQKVKAIDKHKDIYHVVILATYREPESVIMNSTKRLYETCLDPKKLIIVWTRECGARAGQFHEDEFKKWSENLHRLYDDKICKLCTYIHPLVKQDELPGKGANCTWAMKKAKTEVIDKMSIPYENIIVSNFDSDTEASDNYFTRLTYLYLTVPEPTKASYQPLTLYNNNVWDASSFARVVAYSTTFWLMAELARPERMLTFSSHSMSFKTLVDVGFWETDIVTEDSRIFLQCFLHYRGDYRVEPLYTTVSMDTVMGDNIRETIKSLYKQIRRWAWSVEHFPYEIYNFFFKYRTIPLKKKIRVFLMQTEGEYSWATAPILMTIIGRLPLWIASHQQNPSALIQNAPFILETLMSIAMLGIITSGGLSLIFIPQKPKHKKGVWRWPMMIIQWVLTPFTMVIFGSIPAIEAQTRLMTAKYLGFDVTKKTRKS